MNNLVLKVKGLGYFYALFLCFQLKLLAYALVLPDTETLYLNLVVQAKKI